MSKKINEPKKVQDIQAKINQKFPFIQDVNVDIQKVQNGEFKAVIMAHIPAYKPIVASKIHQNFQVALDKSYAALLKMAHKYKTKAHSLKFSKAS